MKTFCLILLCATLGGVPALADSAGLTRNVAYRTPPGQTAGPERCRLDIWSPPGAKGLPVVVWFHGGGLTSGDAWVPEALRQPDLVVFAPTYRLVPAVGVADCIDDAAAAVAWVFAHAAEHGGDPARIHLSGHSAGAYLSAMLTLDPSRLGSHGVDAGRIASLIAVSGQMITHFALRAAHGIPATQAVVDAEAPLRHVRAGLPPVVLITGDRELELYGRYEENAYMARMLRLAGNPNVELHELQGFDHGDMALPAQHLLLRTLRRGTPAPR
jgi:acetyl esterase/lipase